jgi:methylmalonyl-CoA mutase N-terminal domain/subunit
MEEDKVVLADSGFEIKRFYTEVDVARNLPERLGEPGRYPFTRHIYPTGYRVRPWQPSLYSGFGEAEDANARFRYLIAQGNGRANIAFDLPTQLGFDSDNESVADEVGRVGVAIDSLADFERLFDSVPLDQIPVSLNISGMAPAMIAMLASVAERQGVPLEKLRGTIANDIGHEFISRGAWLYPVLASYRLLGDTAEFVVRRMPDFYPFNIRAILLHEQGAAPQQEVGISFAIARSYVDSLLTRGIPLEDFAPRVSFFFGVGLRLFEEAAKFRAARRLWARILREDYGCSYERAQKMRFTCVAGCGSHFTSQLPELNLVRGTLGTLGGALGGAQTMLGTTIDEAHDIPTEYTQMLALRTQQIVALESDVTATVDPLGGSYFVEAMTDTIEDLSRGVMAEVDAQGGVLQAIETGSLQRQIEDRAFRVQGQLDSGERSKVGVNVYRTEVDESHEIKVWEPDPGVLERRRRALTDLRERRSSSAVRRSLDDLASVCASGESVMPAMLAAVQAYATVGEIAARLRDVLGSFAEPVSV